MQLDRIISTIDAHAAGEPLRIFTSGVPPLAGSTMLARREAMRLHHDALRTALLFEPRGHADMYGAILTPPVSPESDYGVLFLTNEGYSTMCGHGIIALTTTLIETGMFPASEPLTTIRFDAPAGFIEATATVTGRSVQSVSFRNVPAFVVHDAVAIETSLGSLAPAVVYGGAFYALLEAKEIGLEVIPANASAFAQTGMEIKHAIEAVLPIVHPAEPGLTGLYGVIFTGPPRLPGSSGRNITVYAEGAVDRSPCGTGTSARLAWLHYAGQIGLDEPYVHESVIDSTFTGRVLETTEVNGKPAIVTEISGRGFITGLHQFLIDPKDPLRDGFLVR